MPRRNHPPTRRPRSVAPWHEEHERPLSPDQAAQALVRAGKASRVILGVLPPRFNLERIEVTSHEHQD